MAGTAASRDVATQIERALTDAGLTVETIEYDAYLSYPGLISVDIVAPATEPLLVTEPPSPLDGDTRDPKLGPGFVAYSASGDVSAPIVYVNYGLPDDYAKLAALHVDVRGRLVLARYGHSHRAVKLHTAQQAGAAGILIYSDPADDGFVRGETWPKGYWRTAEQIRASIRAPAPRHFSNSGARSARCGAPAGSRSAPSRWRSGTQRNSA